jgi:hypothetical protein
MTEPEGFRKPRGTGRGALQSQMKDHLDSLAGSRIGDLSDDDVSKMQIRLDVLERWARLNDSATGDMYHDDDTNLHHHHMLDVVALPRVLPEQTSES